jgi:hypothetical protein
MFPCLHPFSLSGSNLYARSDVRGQSSTQKTIIIFHKTFTLIIRHNQKLIEKIIKNVSSRKQPGNNTLTGCRKFKNISLITISRGESHVTYNPNGHWCNCSNWLDYQHAIIIKLKLNGYYKFYMQVIKKEQDRSSPYPAFSF